MIELAEEKLAEMAADPKTRQMVLEHQRRDAAHRLILGAGRAEGERILLRRQLVRKFGELPVSAEARLRSATEAELGQWAERILTATSLDEVFE